MNSIGSVLEILKEHGIKHIIHNGYITLPTEHCFAVWRIAQRKADGADMYNMFWHVIYEVRICYRENKLDTDTERERAIEDEFRELQDLESKYSYDSNDKLEITEYRFTDIIDF